MKDNLNMKWICGRKMIRYLKSMVSFVSVNVMSEAESGYT